MWKQKRNDFSKSALSSSTGCVGNVPFVLFLEDMFSFLTKKVNPLKTLKNAQCPPLFIL